MAALRLAFAYFQVKLLAEFQYRGNLVLQVFQSLIALAMGLMTLGLVFRQVDALKGWTHEQLLAVMGVHLLMGGLIRMWIQPNMMRLMDDVREGTLDFALTKPVDAQILASVREFRIWQAFEIFLSVAILSVAVDRIGASIGVLRSLSFLILLALGGMMIYSSWLVLTVGVFWVVQIDHVVDLFQGAYQTGRWPVGIYPEGIRMILTFIVPVAFAVTVPAEALTGVPTLRTFVGAVVLASLLFGLSRLLWGLGLRHYSGASA